MKKILSLLLTCALALSCCAALAEEAAPQLQKDLVVLFTSDVHCWVDQGWGMAGLYAIRESLAKDNHVLLVDNGDAIQGEPLGTMTKGEGVIDIMNAVGYDIAVPGNHEFDYGMDNMAKLFRQANFPIVCSNYDCKGTVLEDLVKPYVTMVRDGVKIGLFALAPPLKGLVFDSNCEGITYLDPAETGQKYIDILRRQEKCDLVICISHLGWEISEYPDEKFISLTEGCDLVLGGHTHTYMPTLEYAPDKNGKLIPVDQNGKHGAFIGKLVLNLEKR
jgi:5'-nucleotidase